MVYTYTERRSALVLIKSFAHKGLQKFYETSSKAGINPAHATRLETLLSALDAATEPEDMDEPGRFLHELQGKLQGYWSVRVSGNWRLTFRFVGDDAEVVNYQDYH